MARRRIFRALDGRGKGIFLIPQHRDKYYEYWVSTFEQIDFFDRFVVFVEDDGTNKYHKYECSKFKGDSFWAFNIDAAKDEGYTACPYCH